MGKLLIVNGSPRAPQSNSKQYANLFLLEWRGEAEVYQVTEKRHEEICHKLEQYSDLLLVFPLYADSLPVTLMYFLKELERHLPGKMPTVHVLINCGFLEPEQNFAALEIVRLFCRKNGCAFGTALCIGAGEAILTTPFAFLVKRKIKAMVKRIHSGSPAILKVSMFLPKRVFLRASTQYWIQRGKKHHLTREEMETMDIEGK